MTRTRLIFIFGFLISLAAGFVVGMAVGRAPSPAQATPAGQPTTRHHMGPHSLDDELGLSPQQRTQVHEIFAALRPPPHGGGPGGKGDPFMAAFRERDEAIHQLVPSDRQADYDRIIQDLKRKLEDLKNQREQQINDAEQKMKAVLTPEQWAKFEKIKQEHRTPPMGRGGGGHGSRAATSSSSLGHGPQDGPPPGPPPDDFGGTRDSTKDRP